MNRSTARVARTMALDAATSQVAAIFAERDVPCILLKGPAMAARLYSRDLSKRNYTDVDLLVPPERFDAAGVALFASGYVRAPVSSPSPNLGPASYEEMWLQVGNPDVVLDLHRGFHGIGRPERFWAILHEHAELLDVGGAAVAVPGMAECALLTALHVWHGGSALRPMADLERALATFDDAVWQRAAEVAAECDALAAFTVGIGKRPEGADLLRRLRVSTSASPAVWMSSETSVAGTLGVVAWLSVPGWGRRLRLAPRLLFPRAAFMRYWAHGHPSRRTSRAPGLAPAYGLRLLNGLRALPTVVGGWRASSRAAADSGWTPACRATLGTAMAGVAHRSRLLVCGAPLALWAYPEWRRVHRQLPTRGLEGRFSTRTPPIVRSLSEAEGDGIVRAVLLRSGASCLEEALVRQRWLARRGRSRDVVVGVTSPREGFRAHAWLSGDAGAQDYVELFRKPPAGGVQPVGR